MSRLATTVTRALHLLAFFGWCRDECVSHVRTALEMAVRRDGASGGVIRLCVVSADGVERWTVVPGTGAAGVGEEEEGRREARRASDGGG